MSKIIEAIRSVRWAITPQALKAISCIAERMDGIDPEIFHKSPEGFKAFVPVGSTLLADANNALLSGSEAIIPIEGPIFPKANLFTRLSGATSISSLMNDLSVALEDDRVDRITLLVDSPGGAVTGVSEFADMVKNSSKPVTAYIYGMAASAAYWIVSAANKIILNPTGEVGSIGVVASYTDTSERDAKEGIKQVEIVSTLSPKKRLDPSSDEGRNQILSVIDDLAKVFINTVAENRGVSIDTVMEKFGQGAMYVGEEALSRGMVDAVGNFSDKQMENFSPETGGGLMSLTLDKLKAEHPDIFQAAFDEGVASVEVSTEASQEAIDAAVETAIGAERERMQSIEALAVPGADKIISEAKANGTAPEKVALDILKAQKEGTLPIDNGSNADAEDLGEEAGNLGNQNVVAGEATEAEIEKMVKNIREGAKQK